MKSWIGTFLVHQTVDLGVQWRSHSRHDWKGVCRHLLRQSTGQPGADGSDGFPEDLQDG